MYVAMSEESLLLAEAVSMIVDFFCVHRNAVQLDRLENLVLHGFQSRVVRKSKVEEARVGLRQGIIVLVLPCCLIWLDQQADVVPLEVLVSRWQALLTPHELHKVLLVRLIDLFEHLPEELDNLGILSEVVNS